MRFLCLLTLLLSVAATAADYKVTPAPSWVDNEAFTQAEFSTGIDKEVYFKWFENQIRQVEGYESYHRRMVTINSLQALELASHFNIEFYPAYQKLKVHAVDVVRNGQSISQLRKDQIRLLHAEDELDENIYTGKVKFNLLLEDVRLGDDIFIEYTIEGKNPIFNNKIFEELPIQLSSFAQYLRYQLHLSADKDINHKIHGKTKVTAKQKRSGAVKSYSWTWRNQPRFLADESSPAGEIPYEWLQITEFNSWAEVSAWGSELFYRAKPPSLALNNTHFDYFYAIQDWVEKVNPEVSYVGDDELAYSVRNQLRYTSASEGIYSHLPQDPMDSLAKGFADCKGKVNLFLSYVNSTATTRAFPVLVHSKMGQGLNEWLPTPNAFNHAVLLLKDRDGSERWVDLTQTLKEPELANQVPPDFGYALILQSNVNRLIKMHDNPVNAQKIHVEEDIDVSESMGPQGRVKVSMKFFSYGAAALRESYYKNSLNLNAQFENLYQRLYPGTKVTESNIKLDANSPMVTVSASLVGEPESFWQKNGSQRQVLVYPMQLNSLLSSLIDTSRPVSIGILGPIEYHHKAVLTLPFEPGVNIPGTELDNAFYSYRQKSNTNFKRVFFEALYLGKVNKLTPEQFPEFNREQQALADSMGIRFFMNVNEQASDQKFSALVAYQDLNKQNRAPNLLLILLLVISILSSLVWLKGYKKKFVTPEATPDIQYSGFMGSLFTVALILVVYYLVAIGTSLVSIPLFYLTTWQALTNTSNPLFDSLWQLYIPIYAIGEITTLLLLSVALFWFIRKVALSKSLLLLVIGSKFVISLVSFLLLHLISNNIGADKVPNFIVVAPSITAVSLGLFVFLVGYFRLSKHVQNTIIK